MRSCLWCLGVLGWALCGLGCAGNSAGMSGGGLELRAENLTVTPSTGPVAHVLARNASDRTYRGVVSASWPAGWKVNRASHPVDLRPGQTARLAFAIERGTDDPANRYPVRLVAEGAGSRIEREQVIACNSAPFYKPTIDGKTDDWADAIPVAFTVGGRRTVVSTYWNNQQFCLLVAVEEDQLAAGDAVQFAIAERDVTTPRDAAGKLGRYEFLAVGGQGGSAVCYALARPGDAAGRALEARPLAGAEVRGAIARVARAGGTTHYEIAIPLAAVPGIRPEPGREFCFSVLVHDPDGTGVRDLGAAAGLWPSQRTRFAWCNWPGAKLAPEGQFDSAVEWGFCSSKK